MRAIAVFEDIPDYLHSFDLHLKLDWTKINGNYEGVQIQVAIGDGRAVTRRRSTGRSPSRTGSQPPVVTLPIWTGKVKITFTPVDNVAPNVAPTDPGYLQPTTKELNGVQFGEDRAIVHPRFPVLIDDIAPGRTNIAVGCGGHDLRRLRATSHRPTPTARKSGITGSRVPTDGGLTWSATQIATGQQRGATRSR